MAVSMMIEWGSEPCALFLEDAVWQRILNGESVNIEGDGFGYEGESFT